MMVMIGRFVFCSGDLLTRWLLYIIYFQSHTITLPKNRFGLVQTLTKDQGNVPRFLPTSTKLILERRRFRSSTWCVQYWCAMIVWCVEVCCGSVQFLEWWWWLVDLYFVRVIFTPVDCCTLFISRLIPLHYIVKLK